MAEIELLDEIVEWLDTLSEAEYERVVVFVERLAVLGSRARMPLSRSLGQGLFEMRFTLGSTARRITYRFTKDDRVVLLTTFCKQRQNESAEIHRARRTAAADAVSHP
jgi:putative component of toxin-antitoxin plasmid stabilization module